MVSKLKTSDVTKAFYVNYLKRAEECIHVLFKNGMQLP